MSRTGPRRPPEAPLSDQRPIPGVTGWSRRKASAVDEYFECPSCGVRYPTLQDFDNRRCER